MYLDQAQALFEEVHMASPEQVRPCSEDEVAQLEQRIGQRLPAAYREFLLWMGKGAGRFFVGTDYFYADVSQFDRHIEGAKKLLEENNITDPLPEDAFVFYMHQGYQIMYFRLSAGDDPPIYYYGEGEGYDSVRIRYPSYSASLIAGIEWHVELGQRMAALRREARARRAGNRAQG